MQGYNQVLFLRVVRRTEGAASPPSRINTQTVVSEVLVICSTGPR